jgi:hypothetical protein
MRIQKAFNGPLKPFVPLNVDVTPKGITEELGNPSVEYSSRDCRVDRKSRYENAKRRYEMKAQKAN